MGSADFDIDLYPISWDGSGPGAETDHEPLLVLELIPNPYLSWKAHILPENYSETNTESTPVPELTPNPKRIWNWTQAHTVPKTNSNPIPVQELVLNPLHSWNWSPTHTSLKADTEHPPDEELYLSCLSQGTNRGLVSEYEPIQYLLRTNNWLCY